MDVYKTEGSRKTAVPRTARSRWLAAAVVSVCAVALSVLFLSGYCLGFSVELEGTSLGVVRDVEAVERAELELVSEVGEILGEDCSFGEYDISLEKCLVRKSELLTSSQLECSMLGSIGDIDLRYVLLLDGEEICSADEPDELEGFIDSLIEYYSTDATIKAEPVGELVIGLRYVDASLTEDLNEIAKHVTVRTTDECFDLQHIAYSTVYVDDAELAEGTTQVVTTGSEGVKIITTREYRENGTLISSEITDTTVTVEAVNEVIAVGTKKLSKYDSTGTYIWAANGVISSYFGLRDIDDHKGIDIAADTGDSVWAADAGEVVYAAWLSGYGNLVKIRHDNGEETLYGHLSGYACSVGDRVAQGEVIGYVGSTGFSTGPHLHFELRVNGVAIDPIDRLPSEGPSKG